MKNKKNLSKFISFIIFGCLLSVYGFNCAQQGFNLDGSQNGSSLVGHGVEPEPISQIEKLNSSKALLTSEQVLYSILAQTKMSSASNNLMNEYRVRKDVLAGEADIGVVNGPMFIGITNLAGVACTDLVNRERALAAQNRAHFSAINFSLAPSQINKAQLTQAIRQSANSFWGRDETDAELNVLLPELEGLIAEMTPADRVAPAKTIGVALFMCTAMLASVESITY